ncbi:MAG: hypothetical protein HY862_05510 [Chloroflexi bacterium]|nr:hypothetical protein [Chloroflexota bacterium]
MSNEQDDIDALAEFVFRIIGPIIIFPILGAIRIQARGWENTATWYRALWVASVIASVVICGAIVYSPSSNSSGESSNGQPQGSTNVPISYTSGNVPNAAPLSCPNTLSSRLIINQRGRVTSGVPNRLRESATTDSRQLELMPEYSEFWVLSGPTCNEGFAWWQVNYNGLIGWTAESGSNEYWVEPIP